MAPLPNKAIAQGASHWNRRGRGINGGLPNMATGGCLMWQPYGGERWAVHPVHDRVAANREREAGHVQRPPVTHIYVAQRRVARKMLFSIDPGP